MSRSQSKQPLTDVVDGVPGRYWHALSSGRLQCDVCPRYCKLKDGQRGLCFVRGRKGDSMVLTTYGRSSGFCVDPIEKKPLNHYLPGTPVLSFGTAGYITTDARASSSATWTPPTSTSRLSPSVFTGKCAAGISIRCSIRSSIQGMRRTCGSSSRRC